MYYLHSAELNDESDFAVNFHLEIKKNSRNVSNRWKNYEKYI